MDWWIKSTLPSTGDGYTALHRQEHPAVELCPQKLSPGNGSALVAGGGGHEPIVWFLWLTAILSSS